MWLVVFILAVGISVYVGLQFVICDVICTVAQGEPDGQGGSLGLPSLPRADVGDDAGLNALDNAPGAHMDYDALLHDILSGFASPDAIDQVLRSERVITPAQMDDYLKNGTAGPCRKTRDNNEYAWRQYTEFCAATEHDPAHWPPPCAVWTSFLTLLRGKTHAASAFQTVYTRVGIVGSRLYGGGTPYALYRSVHHMCINLLNRNYGESVKQVAGITTTEANNFHKFVSKVDVPGLITGTAFAFGLASGGKRARSVVAIQLADVEVTVAKVKVHGVDTLVPQVRVRLRDEKVMDSMGARHCGEDLNGMVDYHVSGERTFSWWAYRMLVMRNAFVDFDPMRTCNVRHGDALLLRDVTEFWYLFCSYRGAQFVNTVPLSTRGMSTMTRTVLANMGSDSRGWSAHRKGGVTRAMQRELIKNKGKEISNAFELALLRWGGWDCEHGLKTMRRRYVQGVLDDCLHNVGLALGFDMSDEEQAVKMAAFEGEVLDAPPLEAILSTKIPTLLQLMVYHEPSYVAYQALIDASGLAVIAASRADESIALADRSAAMSELFTDVIKRHSHLPPVRAWLDMRKGQWRAFQSALALAKKTLQAGIDQAFGDGSSKNLKMSGALGSLMPYAFGGMPAWVQDVSMVVPLSALPLMAYHKLPMVFCVSPCSLGKGPCVCMEPCIPPK